MRRDCLDALLREAGIVDDTTVEKADRLQREETIKPVEAFLRLGVIEEGDLVEFLCRRLNLPSADLEDATLDLIIKLALPELPVRHLALPWLVENNVLHVAVVDPTDLDPMGEILRNAGWRFRVYCCALSAIKRVFLPEEWVPDYVHRSLLRKAKRGDSDAQFRMGELNYNKAESSKKYEDAMKWWLLAAASGHIEAAFNIAEMYGDGIGVPVNKETAVTWYRRAAEQGHARAQFALAWLYAEDAPILRNYQEAAKWYRKAAEQGNAAAQNNLGVLYARGQGVREDDGEAAKWYRAAADQGVACAQCNLAFAYETGAGVPKDQAEAVKLFRASAELGRIRAQNALGDRLQNGLGIPKDEGEAVLWFWKAAQQGDAYAQYKLGDAFQNTRGVWPDRTLAMKWYREAARQRNEDARRAIRRGMRLARRSDVTRSSDPGEWQLAEYPVVFRKVPRSNKADHHVKEGRALWSAEIMGWPDMRGTGEREEIAYIDLEERLSAYREAGNRLPAPVTHDLLP